MIDPYLINAEPLAQPECRPHVPRDEDVVEDPRLLVLHLLLFVVQQSADLRILNVSGHFRNVQMTMHSTGWSVT